jgi:hypothetical protein
LKYLYPEQIDKINSFLINHNQILSLLIPWWSLWLRSAPWVCELGKGF